MRDRRYVQDLTNEELEEVLLIRRREERMARMRRMGIAASLEKRIVVDEIRPTTDPAALPGPPDASSPWGPVEVDMLPEKGEQQPRATNKLWRDRILFGVEIVALVGLLVVIASLVFSIRTLNRDWNETQLADALPTPTATPLIRVSVLPGGHKPPTEQGIEPQPLNPVPAIAIPTPGPRMPTRLVIPSINVDVPVVEGVDWEQLKKGAGHLIGSANPGERGNCFLAGHNDIYGEILRYLENVKVGEKMIIYAGQQPYTYIVRATRIVDPDDVSIMYPTSSPILTVMTCYPYMIDTHRLAVIAELEQ
ncbi:MAG: class D sortase [Anaerolineae bacterium]|nr:class D sortase [Anaerolineae bacterium]